MTAIKLIHYSTYHLVTTSHEVHLLALPNSSMWTGSFHSTPAIFTSSKYLYLCVGHVLSKTFKFILSYIGENSESKYSIPNSILSSEIGSIGMVYGLREKKSSVTEKHFKPIFPKISISSLKTVSFPQPVHMDRNYGI